jgi:hypothetical protein
MRGREVKSSTVRIKLFVDGSEVYCAKRRFKQKPNLKHQNRKVRDPRLYSCG